MKEAKWGWNQSRVSPQLTGYRLWGPRSNDLFSCISANSPLHLAKHEGQWGWVGEGPSTEHCEHTHIWGFWNGLNGYSSTPSSHDVNLLD